MKQELLKWIDENKIGRPSVFGLGTVETVYMDDLIEMINELEEPQVTNEQAWNKIAETYPETAQNLRITLDHAVYGHEAEPQKVKVKQFVADWYEKNNENLEFRIWRYIKHWDEHPEDEFKMFMNRGLSKPIETLIRMQDGYEVEE